MESLQDYHICRISNKNLDLGSSSLAANSTYENNIGSIEKFGLFFELNLSLLYIQGEIIHQSIIYASFMLSFMILRRYSSSIRVLVS